MLLFILNIFLISKVFIFLAVALHFNFYCRFAGSRRQISISILFLNRLAFLHFFESAAESVLYIIRVIPFD